MYYLMFIQQKPEGQRPMWQGTAIVGHWQICTSAIMQLYIFYSDNVILYMIIRKTIQYKTHIKIESM